MILGNEREGGVGPAFLYVLDPDTVNRIKFNDKQSNPQSHSLHSYTLQKRVLRLSGLSSTRFCSREGSLKPFLRDTLSFLH